MLNKVNVKEFFKCIGKSILILVAATIIGTAALGAVSLIPQSAIYENTKVSARLLSYEGFGCDILNLRGSSLDIYTDGLMLNTTYTSAGDFRRTMLATTMEGETEDMLMPLYNHLEGVEQDVKTWNYTRYWHGYQIFLRPLLLLGNLITIRAFHMVLQISLVLVVLYRMIVLREGESNSKRLDLAIPFIVFWLSISPVAVASSLQFYSVIYPTLIAAIVLLMQKNRTFYGVWYVFLTSGILIGYFDLLTYPLVSLGVPLILFFCIDREAHKSIVQRLWECVAYSGAWCLGYGGMLVSRWAVASIVSGDNIFLEGIKSILYRTSHEYSGTHYTWMGTVVVNGKELANQLVLFAMVFGFLLFLLNIGKLRRKATIQTMIALLVVTGYPFIWYLVVMQHSNMHQWMTYRNLCVAVYGVMSFLYVNLDFGKAKE